MVNPADFYQEPGFTRAKWDATAQAFVHGSSDGESFGDGVFFPGRAKARWRWQRNPTREAGD